MTKPSYAQLLAEEELLADLQSMLMRLVRHRDIDTKELAKKVGVPARRLRYWMRDNIEKMPLRVIARVFHHLEEELRVSCAGIDALNEAARAKYAPDHSLTASPPPQPSAEAPASDPTSIPSLAGKGVLS